MAQFEVPQPIICSPFAEPSDHWWLEEGTEPRREPGRRPAHDRFDELAEIKTAAAERWAAAVNADGQFGQWRYAMARSIPQVREILDAVATQTT
jgi:hypothetical protein